MTARNIHRVGILHLLLRERSVYDEITIVGYHRTSLGFSHAQNGLRRAQSVHILQYFHICKWSHFDRNTLLPLTVQLLPGVQNGDMSDLH